MLSLLQRDDIWEPQARDGDNREDALHASFPDAWIALSRRGANPVGYILYIPRTPEVFEQHTAFITDARGAEAVRAIQIATDKIFIETPCSRIVTHCPDWHPASKSLARHMGATSMYSIADFATRGGVKYGATLYGQNVMEWAWRNHKNYAHVGARWHDEVFAALEPHHEDDPAHNGFVGMAVEMSRYQPLKAIGVYNTWAQIAGYEQAKLCWHDGQGNAVIDISNAYVVNSPSRVIAAFPKCQPLPPSEPS